MLQQKCIQQASPTFPSVPPNEKPVQQDEGFQNPQLCLSYHKITLKFPKAQPKFNDNPSTSVKDNLSSQKLNINELKRRSSKDWSRKQFLLNYKEQLRHSMKKCPVIFPSGSLTKYKISKEKMSRNVFICSFQNYAMSLLNLYTNR
ncbi:ATV_HP_G0008350.mRNA.1.CDS.1 [Saccharomyces cerevisiae]|nr:ATV_HP_G0008350.mRNA.1.CDS.1 [Saccharomyces cerevisiae]CAI6941614.1 ATV_HP_G0008350.mRNA.1.CDS.1 [Saccharomyces cerevisiae]